MRWASASLRALYIKRSTLWFWGWQDPISNLTPELDPTSQQLTLTFTSFTVYWAEISISPLCELDMQLNDYAQRISFFLANERPMRGSALQLSPFCHSCPLNSTQSSPSPFHCHPTNLRQPWVSYKSEPVPPPGFSITIHGIGFLNNAPKYCTRNSTGIFIISVFLRTRTTASHSNTNWSCGPDRKSVV